MEIFQQLHIVLGLLNLITFAAYMYLSTSLVAVKKTLIHRRFIHVSVRGSDLVRKVVTYSCYGNKEVSRGSTLALFKITVWMDLSVVRHIFRSNGYLALSFVCVSFLILYSFKQAQLFFQILYDEIYNNTMHY